MDSDRASIIQFQNAAGEHCAIYLSGKYKGQVACTPVDGVLTEKRPATVDELCDILLRNIYRFQRTQGDGLVIDPFDDYRRLKDTEISIARIIAREMREGAKECTPRNSGDLPAPEPESIIPNATILPDGTVKRG